MSFASATSLEQLKDLPKACGSNWTRLRLKN
jgi:hypothetical protein